MEFDQFLSLIPKLESSKSGGFESHLKMIPKERIIPAPDEIKDRNPKKAAVLALFYPDKHNETLFLLTLREIFSILRLNRNQVVSYHIDQSSLQTTCKISSLQSSQEKRYAQDQVFSKEDSIAQAPVQIHRIF